MALLANLSFEIGGATPGSAASWTVATLATAFEPGAYLFDATANERGAETFEGRWQSNEAYSFALGSTSAAAYATVGPVVPKPFEDFAELWQSNESYSFSITTAEQAAYDTALDPFEDFEHEWQSNESYLFALGATSAATYDTAPEAFEDFEEDWTLTMTTV